MWVPWSRLWGSGVEQIPWTLKYVQPCLGSRNSGWSHLNGAIRMVLDSLPPQLPDMIAAHHASATTAMPASASRSLSARPGRPRLPIMYSVIKPRNIP